MHRGGRRLWIPSCHLAVTVKTCFLRSGAGASGIAASGARNDVFGRPGRQGWLPVSSTRHALRPRQSRRQMLLRAASATHPILQCPEACRIFVARSVGLRYRSWSMFNRLPLSPYRCRSRCVTGCQVTKESEIKQPFWYMPRLTPSSRRLGFGRRSARLASRMCSALTPFDRCLRIR